MAQPGDYFSDPNEKLLADVVWEVAGNPLLDPQWRPHPVSVGFIVLPHTTERVILARDWITHMREQKDWQTDKNDGGVRAINEFFDDAFKRQTSFTAEQIGNVEHFYVAALESDVFGPARPLAISATATWEFEIGPLRVIYGEAMNALTGKGFNPGAIKRNWKNNVQQFLGPDRNGFTFGFSSGAVPNLDRNIVKFVQDALDNPDDPPLKTNPARFKGSRRRKTERGHTLSLLAQYYYRDAQKWPIIYLENKDKIGTNYNVLPAGIWLDIPFLWQLDQQDLAEAKKIAGNWRPGLDWR